MKIKLKTLLIASVIPLSIFFLSYDQIMMQLEKNETDSSDNLTEHVESISNISTDASNLERINRWNCAIRMFQEEPFFGWGPGTYAFEYAPFQHSQELTIISTNFGDMGNAHSEYLGPLAETGFMGSISVIVLFSLIVLYASLLYIKIQDPEIKVIVLSILLGLITYFIHGILNNYLDTDKASIPIWGFTAILVALDIQYKKGYIS